MGTCWSHSWHFAKCSPEPLRLQQRNLSVLITLDWVIEAKCGFWRSIRLRKAVTSPSLRMSLSSVTLVMLEVEFWCCPGASLVRWQYGGHPDWSGIYPYNLSLSMASQSILFMHGVPNIFFWHGHAVSILAQPLSLIELWQKFTELCVTPYVWLLCRANQAVTGQLWPGMTMVSNVLSSNTSLSKLKEAPACANGFSKRK